MTEQDRFLVEKPLAVDAEESGDRAQKKDGIAQTELQERILEFERFNRLVMAREQRILDLKKEANELAQAAGKPAPYGSLDRIEEDEALDNLVQPMTDRGEGVGSEPEELQVADLLNVEDLQTLLSPLLRCGRGCLSHIRPQRQPAGIRKFSASLHPIPSCWRNFLSTLCRKRRSTGFQTRWKVRISLFINAKMA